MRYRDDWNPAADYAVGIDIGGTKIYIGIIDSRGRVEKEMRIASDGLTVQTAAMVGEQADQLIAGWLKANPHKQLRGIGIGSSGHIDIRSGTVLSKADRNSGYQGIRLREIFEERTGLPVYVDNDANVVAVAEKYFGMSQNAKHVLCVTLGTGVGGALLVNGELVHGAWGGAGELGHFSVDYNGRQCPCGAKGCLQLYASGTGIAQIMNEKMQQSGGNSQHKLDARETIRLWQAGDPLATEVMNTSIEALSSALASLIHLLNLEYIVIGGGMADIGELYTARIEQETRKKSMPTFIEHVTFSKAYGGNRGGMIGAAMLNWERNNHHERGE